MEERLCTPPTSRVAVPDARGSSIPGLRLRRPRTRRAGRARRQGVAIRHSDSARPNGQVTLVVTDCGEAIQVEVIDEGSATNTPQVRTDPGGQGLGGRGLWLVDQMSHSWGSREHTAGRVVWFRMTKKHVLHGLP
ncbi:ATP-binding protein [Thermopolyspora sp. NPDC052614]|uniref:ATP-binding protein n=1 Tax=Thermopolyspora sp. NPDC052614 TaxID=3155682 RepID=UPI00341C82B3